METKHTYRIGLLLLIVLFSFFTNAQNILISQGGTVNVSGGEMFYDAGGPSGNDGNTSYTITLCPSTPGEMVALDFNYFKTTWDWMWNEEDALYIYDGPTATGDDIGKLMGNYNVKYNTGVSPYGMGVEAYNGNPLIATPTIFSATNPSGCLTLQFVNGYNTQFDGWEAEVICYKASGTPGCNISLTGDLTNICAGESIELTADGDVNSAPINNDFNSGSLGTGWAGTASVSFTNNVCSAPSLDGSTYIWMGNASGPRSLETNSMDVSSGGSISFEYRQASNNGGSSPCESPDQGSGTFEGIYLQYSTNGGGSWTTFKYIFPNGTTGSFGSEGGLTGCGDYVKRWTKMQYPIPAAASTGNTKFRWLQDKVTSAGTDNWGLDNVQIITPVSSTITITNETAGGTVVGTSSVYPYIVSVSPAVTTTYRATISDGTTSCFEEFTVTVDPCVTPSCGTCDVPDCGISGPWTSPTEANMENCTAPGQEFINPSIEDITYTTYHTLTADATGNVGVIVSVYTGASSSCTVNKTAELYATAPCTSGAIAPDAINPNAGISYYNPEWHTLTPGATYILKITYNIPAGCYMEDHCVSFYHFPSTCLCTDPCTTGEVRCFEERVYDPADEVTVEAGTEQTFCYTVNSGPNGFIGLVQQVNGGFMLDRTAVLHPVGNCATDINPSVANANGVGSGFNPEWTGLTINTDYVLCITIDNWDFQNSDLIPVTYYAPDCCDDEVGTQNPSITGNGTEDLANNEFILCHGDLFNLTTTGAVPSVDYAIYNCAPTSDNPATDACFTGYYFEQLNAMSENCAGDASPVLNFLNGQAVSFTNNTIWWVPITTDAIGQYDPACYDMDYLNKSFQVTYLNELTATGIEDCANGIVTVTIQGGSPEYVAGDSYSIQNNGAGSLSASTLNTSGGTIQITGLVDGDNYDITITDNNGCSYNYTDTPFEDCNCPAEIGTYQVLINGVDVTSASNEYILCFNDELEIVSNGDWVAPDPASADPAGVGFGFYTETPTGNDPAADPNFSGQIQYTENADDINTAGPASPIFGYIGTATGYFYIVPFTLDDMVSGFNFAQGWDVDGDGCFVMGIPMKFTYLPEIFANAGADVELTCTDPTQILDGTASTGTGTGITYAWTGPGIVSGANTATPTVNQVGVYTLTIETPDGCTDTDQVTVTQDAGVPTANAGPDVSITCTTNTSGAQIGSSNVAGNTYTWSPTSDLSASNISNPVANPTSTTVYTVTVTNTSNGCTASDQVTVTVDMTTPTASAGGAQTITCVLNTNGAPIGSAAVGGNSYAWSPATGLSSAAIANPTANPANTTVYTVTVTDQTNGCTSTDQVMVTVDTATPTANAGTDQTITCTTNTNGASIGSATVGGNSYAWSPATDLSDATISNPIANPSATTIYTLTVTDQNNGCTSTDAITVTVDMPIPPVNAGNDEDITCIDNTVGATIGTAAVGGHSYNWGPTTGLSASNVAEPVASPASTTVYQVTVTNPITGCTSTDDVTVTVDMSNPVADAGIDQIITCSQNTNGASIGSVDVSTYDYSWTPALDLSAVNISDPTATPATTTVYTVTVSNSLNGCTATDQVTVTVDTAAPTADAGIDQSITCSQNTNGANIGSASVSGNSYIWNNSVDLSVDNISDPIANPAVTTIYTVTVTNDNNDCTATDDVTVTVDIELPTASAGMDQNITCVENPQGMNIGANTDPGCAYNWSPASNLSASNISDPIASPIVSTTYTVTVTNLLNDCIATDQVTVTVDTATPTADAGEDQSTCSDEPVGIGTAANPALTYAWDNAANLSNSLVSNTNFVANNSSAVSDFYSLTLTVTDPANGCEATDQVTVEVLPEITPVITIASNTTSICTGEPVTFTANAQNAGSSPTYNWTINGVSWGSSSTTLTVSTLNDGDLVCCTLYPSQENCINPAAVQSNCIAISVLTPEPIDILLTQYPEGDICPTQNVTFQVVSATSFSNTTFQWQINGVNVGSNQSVFTTTGLNNGDQLTCTANIPNPCGVYTSQDMLVISTLTPVNLDLSIDDPVICKGETSTINSMVSGGTGGPYTLTNQQANIITNAYTIHPVSSQNITISLTDGCTSDSETISVEVLNSPDISIQADVRKGCSPLEVHFISTSSEDNLSYRWSFEDFNPDLSFEVNPTHTYKHEGFFDVGLEVSNSEGCRTVVNYTDYIQVYPDPVAEFAVSERVISNLDPEVSFTNYSEGAEYYFWDFGDENYANTFEPKHSYPEAGDYTVQLNVVSQHGCQDSITAVVSMEDAVTFYAPNAFSPGYDHNNDSFVVKGTGIDEDSFLMVIFDRWGEKIFTSNQLSEGWNGRVKNGEVVQNGTYTWLVVFNDTNGVRREHTGPVTVIR